MKRRTLWTTILLVLATVVTIWAGVTNPDRIVTIEPTGDGRFIYTEADGTKWLHDPVEHTVEKLEE